MNVRDRNWQAPLHVCATYNSVNCAKLIIPLMTNIDVTDRSGRRYVNKIKKIILKFKLKNCFFLLVHCHMQLLMVIYKYVNSLMI